MSAKNLIIIICLATFSSFALHAKDRSHKNDHSGHKGHEGHGGQKAIGEGKAIIHFDKERGIKFSNEAISTMNLKLKQVEGERFLVPDGGLIRQREQHAIYIHKNGFFKLVYVTVLKTHNDTNSFTVKLKSKQNLHTNEVLVNNANLVRVSEIYAQDDQKYGHSH